MAVMLIANNLVLFSVYCKITHLVLAVTLPTDTHPQIVVGAIGTSEGKTIKLFFIVLLPHTHAMAVMACTRLRDTAFHSIRTLEVYT